MNETEIKAVLMTAQETLRSRSKFALFCVDLSAALYPIAVEYGPQGEVLQRAPVTQAEYELFWSLMRPFLQLQG